MKSVDHEKAGEIFNDALDLPVEQRAGFLVTECGADTEVRAEAESLLALYNDEFMEENVRVQALERICGSLSPGEKINDRYEIVEMIGRGGMGEVYLAKDTNSAIKRLVALKVLAEEFSQDKRRVQSFENE